MDQEDMRRTSDFTEQVLDPCLFTADEGNAEAWGDVARRYEQMGVYAELAAAHGQEEAEKHFPLLAEHLKGCPLCAQVRDATIQSLNEPDPPESGEKGEGSV